MKEENLNLEYNKKRLILKALNTTKLNKDAAIKLGVSDRSLYKYKYDYNIIYCKVKQAYIYQN